MARPKRTSFAWEAIKFVGVAGAGAAVGFFVNRELSRATVPLQSAPAPSAPPPPSYQPSPLPPPPPLVLPMPVFMGGGSPFGAFGGFGSFGGPQPVPHVPEIQDQFEAEQEEFETAFDRAQREIEDELGEDLEDD